MTLILSQDALTSGAAGMILALMRVLRTALPLVLASWCPGQLAPANPDPATYEAFFKKVVELKRAPDQVRINGETVRVSVPKLQDVIGLADAEVDTLNQVAAECVRQLNALDQPKPWIFEARLEQLAGGEMPEALAQQMQRWKDRRPQIVLEQVQQLKAALGESFVRVDFFVHSPENPRSLQLTLPKAVSR